jgi:hypothetical protein
MAAAGARVTTTPLPNNESRPPQWAEGVVRWFISPRDRDTITGDLLEEYREVAVPAWGHARATVWYLGQGVSLMTHSKVAMESAWVAVGMVMLSTLMFLLNRSHFGPPGPLYIAIIVAVVLGSTGATAVRSAGDVRFLGRMGLTWGSLFSSVLIVRILVDVFKPLTDGLEILSQNGAGRGFVLGVAIALIFVAAGFHGAWRTGRVRMGIVTAIATSMFGCLITITIMGLVSTPSFDLRHTDGPGQVFRQNGGQATLVVLMLSTVPGTIGAAFGRGVQALLRRRTETVERYAD